ncbi:MAG TPA: hypothetical protein VFN95_03920 [Flavitalea sp.]|nr:hypothetical protein [Flavitalea sp.]
MSDDTKETGWKRPTKNTGKIPHANMNKSIFLFLVIVIGIQCASAQDFPQAKITNGLIDAVLYLPDPEKGYYRASRFDWSGVICRLVYKGHNYFDVWNPLLYDPKLHDAIVGPVEEFRLPLRYDEAKVGETFIKIGVGSLNKIQEPSYRFSYTYDIVNGGKWSVQRQKDQVSFTHEFADSSGYSYLYSKTVQLIKGKPVMVLQHSLKNVGKKPIETTVYNHNFFVIDNEPTGPNMRMSFPFNIKVKEDDASLRGFGTVAEIQGKSIVYKRELNKGETVFSGGLQGYKPVPEDYNIKIENVKTGAGVVITGDAAIDKLVYWACSTTACPEPYIKLNVDPGKEIKWKYTYEFFVSGSTPQSLRP